MGVIEKTAIMVDGAFYRRRAYYLFMIINPLKQELMSLLSIAKGI